jgi:hypothetical protein
VLPKERPKSFREAQEPTETVLPWHCLHLVLPLERPKRLFQAKQLSDLLFEHWLRSKDCLAVTWLCQHTSTC